MILTASPTTLRQASQHLTAHDAKLAPVIAAVGPCTIVPHTNYYQALVQSIVGQQLSIVAAAAILARFKALFGDDFPRPEQILAQAIETFRSVGFSRAKAAYVQDLAARVLDDRLVLDNLNIQDNAAIITQLTAVKGVGEWTAHMFLMFCMGRLDVLPVGDLGIKNGIRKLYNLEQQPTAQDVEAIAVANNWHPYESIASWYVWQSLKLPE